MSPCIARPPVWLFDLDNTLHDASRHIFPHINLAMRRYIETHLGLDPEAAGRLRQHYWERYGATLLGLMRHHAIAPRHFLEATHAFDDLASHLVFDPAIKSALKRLPGRKILYSNAPAAYTRAILAHTGLLQRFDALHTIERSRFQPKPSPAGLRRLLRAENLDPRRCILVEDSLANLVTAKRMGMRTVWICGSRQKPGHSPWVDVRLTRVRDLPRRLADLGLSARKSAEASGRPLRLA